MNLQKLFNDANVPLLYVGNLVEQILEVIRNPKGSLFEIRPDLEVKVTEVLRLLNSFKDSYIDKNTIPSLKILLNFNSLIHFVLI